MKHLIIVPFLFFLFSSCSAENASKTIDPDISSFEECVAAGNPVLRSYPPQCRTSEGKHFTKKIKEEQPEETKKPSAPEKICKDLCGDGVCQQIVCMAEGCPCAESPENCAKDCAMNF